jgi:hypothetical protein
MYLKSWELTEENKYVIKYGLMPVKVLTTDVTTFFHPKRPDTLSTFLDTNNCSNIKNILLVVSQCKSSLKYDFKMSKLCSNIVNIELKNLSNTVEFDLILIAKNPK